MQLCFSCDETSEANNPEYRWDLIMAKSISGNYSARNNEAGAVSKTVKYKYSKIKDHDTNEVPTNI